MFRDIARLATCGMKHSETTQPNQCSTRVWVCGSQAEVAKQTSFSLFLRPENQGKLYSIPLMDWLADKYKDTPSQYLRWIVVVSSVAQSIS